MVPTWNVALLPKYGDNKEVFNVTVEAIDEKAVVSMIETAYPNAFIESVNKESGDAYNIDNLYDNLKGLSVDVATMSESSYLHGRNLFGEELSESLSGNDFITLNVLMEKQDRLLDKLLTSHNQRVMEWAKEGSRRYESLKEFIQSETTLKNLFATGCYNDVEEQLSNVSSDICSILEKVVVNEVSVDKIDKPSSRRKKFEDLHKRIRRSRSRMERREVSKTRGSIKETLYICEDCAKTFRSNESTCPDCKKSAEPVVKGQEELAPELEVDEGGDVKDTGEQQNKVKESHRPFVRSLAEETEKDTRKVVARGIVDKAEAEKLAASKQGVVVQDDEDKEKFMVMVKEAKKVEAEEKYKKPEDFDAKKRATINELAKISRQIEKIKKKFEPLSKKQSEYKEKVLDILATAKETGVRVDEVLMYIREGSWKDPTYKEVLAEAQSRKMKKFVEQLEDLSKDLIKWQEGGLRVKVESKSGAGILAKVKSLFKQIASALPKLKKKSKANESINESEDDDNVFTSDADLTVISSSGSGASVNHDIKHDKKISIKYRIEMDYRSWGLKDVNVSVVQPITVQYTMVMWGDDDNDEEIEKSVTIDPENIEIIWAEGSGIVPWELTVVVSPEGTLEQAELEFSYWKP